MAERTVLITGATGKQGGAVARALAGKGFKIRAMTRKPLEEAQWIKLERDIKEDFQVVEHDKLSVDLSGDFLKQSWDPQRPLPLCKLKHALREFQINIDHQDACPSGDLLQGHGLPRTPRSNYKHEPVVESSCWFELPHYLIIQRLGHQVPLCASELGSTDASNQRSIAAFRNRQCRPIFLQGILPSRTTL